jgi:hypothetical protein
MLFLLKEWTEKRASTCLCVREWVCVCENERDRVYFISMREVNVFWCASVSMRVKVSVHGYAWYSVSVRTREWDSEWVWVLRVCVFRVSVRDINCYSHARGEYGLVCEWVCMWEWVYECMWEKWVYIYVCPRASVNVSVLCACARECL